mmetsp:Transcript_38758/g.83503  ORF Transcript_38758/g.83503 Transcript_38758/m.83503 type:complete len:91 (+) Transcript_38758:933-1205(+)
MGVGLAVGAGTGMRVVGLGVITGGDEGGEVCGAGGRFVGDSVDVGAGVCFVGDFVGVEVVGVNTHPSSSSATEEEDRGGAMVTSAQLVHI